MPDPTRDAAFALVSAVLDQGRARDDALEALPAADARDRAAAHRLAAAVLRRAGTLDAVLEPFLAKAPPVPVRHVLRLGAAGLLLLDTPAHAAVATAVALARARGLVPFCPLVNAVLRRVAGLGPAALESLDGPRLDTPPWLWASWGAEARAIATAHQQEAPLDLSLYPGTPVPTDWLRSSLWVAEIIYFPLETALLRAARALGCRTLDGGGMAVFQAVGAFELFTGLTPEAERMLHHFGTLVRPPAIDG